MRTAVECHLSCSCGFLRRNTTLPLMLGKTTDMQPYALRYLKSWKPGNPRTLLDAKGSGRYTVSSSRMNWQRAREDRGADAEILYCRGIARTGALRIRLRPSRATSHRSQIHQQ